MATTTSRMMVLSMALNPCVITRALHMPMPMFSSAWTRPSASSLSQQYPFVSRRLSTQHTEQGEAPSLSLYDRGQIPAPETVKQLKAKGIRPYFYFIDIHGQVFLQDTRPKNFVSCYKDPKFLDFFINRIKPNATAHFPEYPWLSPCGKEMNFVEAADTPIVFHSLQEGQLLWGGTLRTPFLPDQLRVSMSTGRIYHPLSRPIGTIQEPSIGVGTQRGFTLGLLKSSMVLSELAANLDQDSLLWQGQRCQLHHLP
ncbi:hypothetical protein BC939DRAFT_449634 [Gamsiella multidivaricata]|uniref:uncharacterized protein n=1 Tax=Gamsiella multidivaricata TaxID=101098 RepID=UPI00221ECE7D|nr:uncharacterized protein BC939DRAFT_449634 [Gamsiella multidivaricata]KAI7824625.1 hypothetical protein BC939DRAFT_449634 [Gamsiella multidivaricata]